MGRRVLDVAGDWVIEIYADDLATGSYAFRVVDVPAARETAISVGDTVTDATTRIGEWHRYRFAATTGDIVYLDALGECVPGLYWRLLDTDGHAEDLCDNVQRHAPRGLGRHRRLGHRGVRRRSVSSARTRSM